MLLGVAEPSLPISQRHADPCYCWRYTLRGYVKEKQRSYCWGRPDILQAAQDGHLSTSIGQTAQSLSRANLRLREATEGCKAANRHLPLSEIDEPLGLAQGRQVSPISVEKKLPLLFFGESATHLLPQVEPVSQAAEYSCDHKPLTYEESSTRGCVAPSPLYTRRNIANTSELSAGALPRRILEPTCHQTPTKLRNRTARCLQVGKRNDSPDL